LLLGAGTYGVASAASSGPVTIGTVIVSIGAGIVAIGGAFVSAIAMPVIITILVFPVIVALTLFIINSGAYVVPPSSYSSIGPRDCSVGVPIADRAKAINVNLQRGFNNYFNKSPDYPELWNQTLFNANPNPPIQTEAIDADDMFWCNYTPLMSFFEATDELIPFPLSAMMNYFQSEGKWVSGEVATTNDICPGDAIFFKSPAYTSLLSHVAVVYSVTEDDITVVQSNSPGRTWTYPTDATGHFPIYGTGNATIRIVGFGAP
jgi:hypothetical protein